MVKCYTILESSGHPLLSYQGDKNIFPLVFPLYALFLIIFPQKAENDPWLKIAILVVLGNKILSPLSAQI